MASYVNPRTNISHLEAMGNGYIHYHVNHSIEWINDLIPQLHTNTIEREWRGLKGYISHQKRTWDRAILNDYVNAFVLLRNIDQSVFYEVFMNILSNYVNNND